MVPDAGELEHHGGGEAISGSRKRRKGLQRPIEIRSRGTGGTVDLRRPDTRQTELYGRAAGQAEPPGTRYHRILKRIRDIPSTVRVLCII